MKLCNDVITVYNRYTDATTRYQVYIPTVISNVHWFGTNKTNPTNDGLVSAKEYIIRIPIEADFSNNSYASPKEYEKLTTKTGYFTLAEGDIIVKGKVVETGQNAKPAYLHSNYDDVVTIISVTDSRTAPNAPHWRVVCK
ncbi:MAG: hypothetical protein J5725_11965 [Bacteroidales bacterium]|nr:hypothetical protein [Bacteroidales bacterium]